MEFNLVGFEIDSAAALCLDVKTDRVFLLIYLSYTCVKEIHLLTRPE